MKFLAYTSIVLTLVVFSFACDLPSEGDGNPGGDVTSGADGYPGGCMDFVHDRNRALPHYRLFSKDSVREQLLLIESYKRKLEGSNQFSCEVGMRSDTSIDLIPRTYTKVSALEEANTLANKFRTALSY